MLIRYSLCLLFAGLLMGWISACTGVGPTANLFRPSSPHDQYGQSLKQANLDRTALGIDWMAAGERALKDSLKITVPYRESGYFSATKAFAVGYRVDTQRGDRLQVRMETQGQQPVQVFIEVFSVEKGGKTSLVAATKADTNVLAWEPRKTQTYLIRVQPELLRTGNYTLTITREPALAFPVQGRDSKQIASFFGANRDGGRRKHEGVDIFAPRGTPALASVNGIVTGVATNSLGGNVVFLADNERNIRLYYAHLDSQNVSNGQHISIGDTVGFVGNTGNARTTGPHLHFGIYQLTGGATDPLPFIRLGRGPARQTLPDTARLGDSIRVSAVKTALRLSPGSDSPALRELSRSTALTIMGGTEAWLRVALTDGTMGYVSSRTTESQDRPLRRFTLTAASPLRDANNQRAGVVKVLKVDTPVQVLASAGGFQLIRTNEGTTGWLADDSPK